MDNSESLKDLWIILKVERILRLFWKFKWSLDNSESLKGSGDNSESLKGS